jgi:hypothetical protein
MKRFGRRSFDMRLFRNSGPRSEVRQLRVARCDKISDQMMDQDGNSEALRQFGKRIQRCYGCFIAYHLKDMYMGEDVTFYCSHCKDDTMFHFDEFSRLIDASKLKESAEGHHH